MRRKHFSFAVTLYSTFVVVQKRVIREFLVALEQKMLNAMVFPAGITGSSIIEKPNQGKTVGIGSRFWKRGWENKFFLFIGTTGWDSLDRVYMGVWRNHETTWGYDPEYLRLKLNDRFGEGETLPYWVCRRYFDRPYDNWSSTGLLSDLKFSRERDAN